MKLVTDNIAGIAPYIPGKPLTELARELGSKWPAEGAIKLASNENPLGPSPKARAAVAAILDNQNLYPDGAAFYLRQAVAKHHQVPESDVLVGAGSNELINMVAQTFVGPDEEVLAPVYSFLCYRLACEILGRRFVPAPLGADYQYDVDAILAKVTPRTKVLFIANPNNPTGAYMNKSDFETLLARVPSEVIVVVDEAYFEYARAADYPSAVASRGLRERLVSLRTFSKVYGLAGLRVGYAVMPAELVGLMNRVRMPFNTSAVGQAAAEAALGDSEHVNKSVALNARELEAMVRDLGALGIPALPSQGNFILVDASGTKLGAAGLNEALLHRGVIVRPVANYGLPKHLRITIGTEAENARLKRTVGELLK